MPLVVVLAEMTVLRHCRTKPKRRNYRAKLHKEAHGWSPFRDEPAPGQINNRPSDRFLRDSRSVGMMKTMSATALLRRRRSAQFESGSAPHFPANAQQSVFRNVTSRAAAQSCRLKIELSLP